jgi:hypothetical protein
MFGLAACSLFAAITLTGQNMQIFKGEVCLGTANRATYLGSTHSATECKGEHGKRGAHYFLADPVNNTVYRLEGHKRPGAFAGNDVIVIGSLDRETGTIYVEDLFRAFPQKVTQAKSVYIDCDACPRGMAVAWLAAFEELTDWGRFDVVPDPKKADLIFLLSANPYLGDYVTRDGPDKRPVSVDITYVNVVDPLTGKSFWDDSRQWGALLVARATKDLIAEFKEQLKLEETVGKS